MEAKKSSRQVARTIQKLIAWYPREVCKKIIPPENIRVVDLKIVNIWARTQLPWDIKLFVSKRLENYSRQLILLQSLATENKECSYEPELNPNITYQVDFASLFLVKLFLSPVRSETRRPAWPLRATGSWFSRHPPWPTSTPPSGRSMWWPGPAGSRGWSRWMWRSRPRKMTISCGGPSNKDIIDRLSGFKCSMQLSYKCKCQDLSKKVYIKLSFKSEISVIIGIKVQVDFLDCFF